MHSGRKPVGLYILTAFYLLAGLGVLIFRGAIWSPPIFVLAWGTSKMRPWAWFGNVGLGALNAVIALWLVVFRHEFWFISNILGSIVIVSYVCLPTVRAAFKATGQAANSTASELEK